MLFGQDENLEFAWLPSVPQGRVDATYTVDGETRTASASGTTITTGATSAS